MERTLVLIKTDGVRRGLIGEIISRYEKKGLKIVALKMVNATSEILEKHYAEHKGKNFYKELINYMMQGPIVAMILEGNNGIKLVRKMHGATNPLEAEIGTIRGDFANSTTENIVHASDSINSAEREIDIWFKHNY